MGTLGNWWRVAVTALALFASVSPGRAVTCDEVRALSAAELDHWAERLQVPPKYLAALLERAFCASATQRERMSVQDERLARSRR
jgi:hypothetical protein